MMDLVEKRFRTLLFALSLIVCTFCSGIVFAQEPPIGAQNGLTWQGLNVGTPAQTVTRKTFYVDGLYNMSVFWSQHADLKEGGVDYNDAFIGMDVGQIRDGLCPAKRASSMTRVRRRLNASGEFSIPRFA